MQKYLLGETEVFTMSKFRCLFVLFVLTLVIFSRVEAARLFDVCRLFPDLCQPGISTTTTTVPTRDDDCNCGCSDPIPGTCGGSCWFNPDITCGAGEMQWCGDWCHSSCTSADKCGANCYPGICEDNGLPCINGKCGPFTASGCQNKYWCPCSSTTTTTRRTTTTTRTTTTSTTTTTIQHCLVDHTGVCEVLSNGDWNLQITSEWSTSNYNDVSASIDLEVGYNPDPRVDLPSLNGYPVLIYQNPGSYQDSVTIPPRADTNIFMITTEVRSGGSTIPYCEIHEAIACEVCNAKDDDWDCSMLPDNQKDTGNNNGIPCDCEQNFTKYGNHSVICDPNTDEGWTYVLMNNEPTLDFASFYPSNLMCSSNNDCVGSKPVCDLSTGQCVECLYNNDQNWRCCGDSMWQFCSPSNTWGSCLVCSGCGCSGSSDEVLNSLLDCNDYDNLVIPGNFKTYYIDLAWYDIWQGISRECHSDVPGDKVYCHVYDLELRVEQELNSRRVILQKLTDGIWQDISWCSSSSSGTLTCDISDLFMTDPDGDGVYDLDNVDDITGLRLKIEYINELNPTTTTPRTTTTTVTVAPSTTTTITSVCEGSNDGDLCPNGRCYDGDCCTGCWDGYQCHTYITDTDCGVDGNYCMNCDSIGMVCYYGRCEYETNDCQAAGGTCSLPGYCNDLVIGTTGWECLWSYQECDSDQCCCLQTG